MMKIFRENKIPGIKIFENFFFVGRGKQKQNKEKQNFHLLKIFFLFNNCVIHVGSQNIEKFFHYFVLFCFFFHLKFRNFVSNLPNTLASPLFLCVCFGKPTIFACMACFWILLLLLLLSVVVYSNFHIPVFVADNFTLFIII